MEQVCQPGVLVHGHLHGIPFMRRLRPMGVGGVIGGIHKAEAPRGILGMSHAYF